MSEEIIEETQPLPEEPVPNIVFVRAKKKKERKSLQPTIQVLVSLVTAIVAVTGIILSFLSARTQWNTARSNRFTYAIEHLKDDSLAIRMGALYELGNYGLEVPNSQGRIVRILNPFIREGIEDIDLLWPAKTDDGLARPKEDVFLACEFVFLLSNSHYKIELDYLQAEEINLSGIYLYDASLISANLQKTNLQNARLVGANLQYADLSFANLRGADLSFTTLEDVDLRGANLWDVKGLTVEQLHYTTIDETTKFESKFRAEYDKQNFPQVNP